MSAASRRRRAIEDRASVSGGGVTARGGEGTGVAALPHTAGPEEAAGLDPACLGGKAANLAALGRAGLPVPPWFCLTTAVFREVYARLSAEIERALADLDHEDRAALERAAARARELFLAAGLARPDREALLARFDAAFPAGAFVAVRSSARGEDSARDSFAGQMDTYLFVERAALEEKVLSCFASAFSARALLYRRLRGLPLAARGVEAAVIVQRMIESRAAGILFTANPTSGERGEAVISAGLGLGEGVVGDLVESDTYFLDLASGAVRERVIAQKRARVAFDRGRGGGTHVVPVSEDEGARPALAPSEIGALADLARRAEAHFGAPQDIEWALDGDGRAYILQARPITTLDRRRETIFDNANIVESYPGLSLPLTFSFARAAYERCFRESSRMFGVPERVLAERHDVHANLLGLVEGRIYYNILNWYDLFTLVPGFEGALPAWEKALGLRRRFLRPPPRESAARRLARIPVKLRMVRRILTLFATLDRRVAAFRAAFDDVHAEFRAVDLASIDAHAALEIYERLERRLLGPYAISVVNDFFAQQLHEAVGKLVSRWDLGDPASLRNDLLCGEKGMESVEPVRSALGLAAAVRADARLLALFEDGRAERDVWRAIHEEPGFAAFREALGRHIALYGDRTLHELKLETPPADEDPTFLVAMLRNYLRGGQEIGAMEARERAIRDAAEAALAAKLRGKPLRRRLFGYVLGRCRRAVKNRENLRLLRTRAFGMVKRLFRAIGRRFAEARLLDDPLDIFWLTIEEVAGTIRGACPTRDLRALVALRKREYEGFAKKAPAPRVTARGIVYAADLAGEEAPPPAAGASGQELRGVGCSPGRVRARAKVILSPEAPMDIRGEVLVAPMTDPGWVFLMVAAGGIVSEKGSLLSHTAIIGRELGIPTVVGVKGATRAIADGRTVEIDGKAGTVTLL
jgi:pyruvate,water dikinase